jgi:hypothetical protein
MGVNYLHLQSPAPGPSVAFSLAGAFFVGTFYLYYQRLQPLKTRLGLHGFKGYVRVAALISAFLDTHDSPGFAILRICTKSFLFLGILQVHYGWGFLFLGVFNVIDSLMDTIRILMNYRRCKSLDGLTVMCEVEANLLELKNGQKLKPLNVYEDLQQPGWMAFLVFLLQVRTQKESESLIERT